MKYLLSLLFSSLLVAGAFATSTSVPTGSTQTVKHACKYKSGCRHKGKCQCEHKAKSTHKKCMGTE